MINRKLCGYDVNGWRDGVARNWIARPGDEEELGVVRIVEGAVLPEVVLAGEGKTERWIGGVQADLAPHGRGGGWGKYGAPERRKTVRSLINDETVPPSILAAAFTGLAQGANHSDGYEVRFVIQSGKRWWSLLVFARQAKVSPRTMDARTFQTNAMSAVQTPNDHHGPTRKRH